VNGALPKLTIDSAKMAVRRVAAAIFSGGGDDWPSALAGNHRAKLFERHQ
jgi:hypothetical protein